MIEIFIFIIIFDLITNQGWPEPIPQTVNLTIAADNLTAIFVVRILHKVYTGLDATPSTHTFNAARS
jgi:hypothetical protein